MYAQDYDEALPTTRFVDYPNGLFGSPDRNNYNWGAIWLTLYPYTRNDQILTCPSALDQLLGPANARIDLSYAYNEYVYDQGRGYSKLAALGGSLHGVADVALVADSRFAGIFNDWDAGGTGPGTAYNVTYLARVALANGASPRHDGSNLAFGDGHAKYFPVGRILCPGGQGATGEYPIVNPAASSAF